MQWFRDAGTVHAMKTLKDLLEQAPQHVIFACVAGSRAYGTSTLESDEDIRGVYAVRADSYLNLTPPAPQLADERGNVVYFSLRRFIDLLADANPNVLELLYIPPDCIRLRTAQMDSLLHSRDLFITRQCADTHVGYAMSQIKKARGQNKWVNQPKSADAPIKEQFCYVIPRERLQQTTAKPCRPVAELAHRLSGSCRIPQRTPGAHPGVLQPARCRPSLSEHGASRV